MPITCNTYWGSGLSKQGMPLSRAFVEDRIQSVPYVPPGWEVIKGNHYLLDLRMLQIQHLNWDFTYIYISLFSDEECHVTSKPAGILQLTLSLNELCALDHEVLAPLHQLRHLDASLNKINRYAGVETLTELRYLNLSYNCISDLQGIYSCRHLQELNLAVNQLTTISSMPAFSTLNVLHINDNKLESLAGVQALPHLKELYAQCNDLTSLFEVSSNFRLEVLNVASNQVTSVESVLQSIKTLGRLRTLVLKDNPVSREIGYYDMLTENTPIVTLDNTAVRPVVTNQGGRDGSGFLAVKETVRRAFMHKLQEERQRADGNIKFLQNRIRSVQKNYEECERKTWRDLESCSSYLDTVPLSELQEGDLSSLREKLSQFRVLSLEDGNLPSSDRRPGLQTDEAKVEDTDEVLRLACRKLMDEKDKQVVNRK